MEPMDFMLSGNNAFGARFGSAIAVAGDLNSDGFNGKQCCNVFYWGRIFTY